MLFRSGTGYANFTFQVQDDGGTANGGQNLSASKTMTINVTAVNDAPSVSDSITDTHSEGYESHTVDLLSFASDVDSGETATLSIQGVTYSVDGGASSATVPAGLSILGSTLTVDTTSSAFDSLNVNQHRTIVVSYKVTDAQGATVKIGRAHV